MSALGECNIMDEITKTEEAIRITYQRLKILEQKLNNEVPANKKNIIEKELEEVRKLLKTHEDQLAHLRTHNRKTFVFAAALIFIIFTVYVLYVLIGGSDF